MRSALRSTVVVCVFALSACQSDPETLPATSSRSTAVPESQVTRPSTEPFTHTSRILVNGKHVGYLVQYDAVPVYEKSERSYATGSALIEDLDFHRVGFVTPSGGLWRVSAGATPGSAYSDFIKEGELQRVLPFFFDPTGAASVKLEPIGTGSTATRR